MYFKDFFFRMQKAALPNIKKIKRKNIEECNDVFPFPFPFHLTLKNIFPSDKVKSKVLS